MRVTLPDAERISFLESFGQDRLDKQGETHRDFLDDRILSMAPDAVVALDLRGVDYLGYSYAKRALREILLRRNEGRYGERRLYIVADQDQDFIDGLEASLRERKMFTMVVPGPDSLEGAQLVGEVPDYIAETFEAVRRHGPIATGSLAKMIDESPQNTKNRLDRLAEMGLLKREKLPSPTGGLEWINSIL